MAKYPLSEIQTNAILELRLYQLTGLERGKIEAEYIELMKLIEELRSILASEAKLLALIKKELVELRDKYASPRRTEIIDAEGELRMEDVIPNEGAVITISHLGFIKRTPVAEYRSQKRGGKGVIGAETYEDDFVENLFTASTHDIVLFLTSTGQCHAKKIYEIPEGTRTAKGKSVASFLRLTNGEKLASMLCFKEFSPEHFVVMVTREGAIKKTALAEYEGATREGGIRGMKIDESDAIVGCVLTNGSNELILVSHQGQAVRFFEGADETAEAAEPAAGVPPAEGEAEATGPKEGLRAQGRFTGGVTGMRFKKKGDYVQALEVC